jgi:hypothetical protein
VLTTEQEMALVAAAEFSAICQRVLGFFVIAERRYAFLGRQLETRKLTVEDEVHHACDGV